MSRVIICCLAIALAVVLWIHFSPADEPPAEPLPGGASEIEPVEFEVERHADIAYRADVDADPTHHILDLYIPTGAKNFPVLVFVHGGAWETGSKNLYIGLSRTFARHGIGVVAINYRLSPKVMHPAHAQDVAQAVSWTHENIANYGGNTERITLMGHSAGGHLVSLLATDPEYLKAVNLEPRQIAGVITVSGLYEIDPTSPLTVHAFGTDADACKKASPMTYAAGIHPPFLIVYTDNDYPHFERMAINFQAALEKSKNIATLLKLTRRNHISEIVSVLNDDDPLNQAIRHFVLK
jgi:acetyl esterase/lipase